MVVGMSLVPAAGDFGGDFYQTFSGELKMSGSLPDGYFPMEAAPKDKPILGWCVHDADPYFIDDGSNCLTMYGAHAEGIGHVSDGPHVLIWGGSFKDVGEYGHVEAELPDWWYRFDSDFEVAANPIAWAPIPDFEPPTT